MDDLELIESYRSGNETAMEELILKYQKNIYRLAYRMTSDMEESKDIAQNTFLQAIKNLDKFRRESLFKTWLYQIAINLCLSFKGKHRHNHEELQENIVVNQSGALNVILNKERDSLLMKSMSEVPERQRLAILLRTYEGLNCREVADIMNISEGAVRANYHNGVKKLKELLKGYRHGTKA
ncbi:MAG: RNA polymerase sigma factor [Nitrospirota bacterium]